MTDDHYVRALAYLRDYARVDWVMLSSVVGSASEIAHDCATLADVGETAMRLAGDLAASGAPPGRLESHGFVPWEGPPAQQLDRLRDELFAMIHEQGRLPAGGEICWFSMRRGDPY